MFLKVGMLFDDVESVQEFYMNYAHDIGYWDMQTKTKGKKIRVHANARYAKMSGMIDVIVQRKNQGLIHMKAEA